MKRILIPALIALGLTAAACGTTEKTAEQAPPSSSAPASTPTPPTSDPGDITDNSTDEPSAMALGGTAEITSEDGTDGSVTVSKLKITTRPADSYGSKPDRGYFLIFTVKLRADKQLSVDEYEFYITTKSGEHVDEGDGNSYDAANYDDVLSYVELNAGEHKTGLLIFDAPSKHGTLNYAPNYEGGPIASWTF
jgi:hypothetical protein